MCCFVLFNLQNALCFHITFQAKLEATKYRNKAFPLYDKLAEVYGVDKAIRDKAGTIVEMRAKQKASQPQYVDSTEEVDMLVSQNEILLENVTTNAANVSIQKTIKESGKESAFLLKQLLKIVRQRHQKG